MSRVPGAVEQPSFPPEPVCEPLETEPLETELRFYRDRAWCLNAFPTVREVVQHLHEELARMDDPLEEWQRTEVMTNVFLLSCAIADTVDDYVLGPRFDFSKATDAVPALGGVARGTEGLLRGAGNVREWRLRRVRTWREAWGAAVVEFLTLFVAEGEPSRDALGQVGANLARLLGSAFPVEVLKFRPRIPAAFRSQDLTHFDVQELGRRFTASFPEGERPILVVGLRTAGSYFAPLLSAWLAVRGYRSVSYMTFRPKTGIARWENEALTRCASAGGLAVIVDEPPGSGGTLAKGVHVLRKAGFAARDVVALLPIHPTRRDDWAAGEGFLSLPPIHLLALKPEQYHKHRLLEREAVEARLAEYFGRRKYSSVRVMSDTTAERLNLMLRRRLAGKKFHTRLMRIYGVQLGRDDGPPETRYVLAKSVGWGWLGYHAFIAGERLSAFVPPILGLRDGILYTEWLLPSAPAGDGQDRAAWIETAASYIAARVRCLSLPGDPSPDVGSTNQYPGLELLARTLAQAYGRNGAALKRPRLGHELVRRACPVPTLIDARMHPQEWIAGARGLRKADFEHHGQGKHQLNVTDPAYDLAEAILFLALSEAEEERFINRYIEESGDTGVKERLFFNKVLAGTWARSSAVMHLADGHRADRAQEHNQLYLDAWNFLIRQTVRVCGGIIGRPTVPRWQSPLVVLDVDGVLDTLVFGFPSATAAGLRALSLLHRHDVAVALNTARSLPQVKEYCRAYGFVGGVADYGGVVWDAVTDREQVLVSAEALEQLERVRNALRRIPGVFINEDYQHSIRAYTYDYEGGKTVCLPMLLVRHLMANLKVDRLAFHQTFLDTAIVAKGIDKGKGLLALLELAGRREIETIAIGDTRPDLAMFRAATRSFAPSQISCPSSAKLLGCRIADHPYQAGLLWCVQSILHPSGERCDRCRAADRLPAGAAVLPFWRLLEAADRNRVRLLLKTLLDPMILQAFAR